jgi:hypothetical protein
MNRFPNTIFSKLPISCRRGVGKLIEKQLKYSTLLYCVRPVGSFDGGSYDTCYTVESSIRNGKQISNEFILDISDINEDYAGTLYPII